MEAIQALQTRLQTLLADDFELMTCDEALFSVDAYVQRHWTKKNEPLAKASRWSSHKPVVVFAVISASRGIVHYHFGVHSFNALDICTALQEVREKVGDGVKIALGADNARIHRANVTTQLMRSPEVDIEPIWNVAARPDGLTVGVEQLWSQAKHHYRAEVDRLRALNRDFDHMHLVQHILGRIDNEMVIRLAAHAVPAVMEMQPIEPLAGEKIEPNWSHFKYFSPERQMGFDDEMHGITDQEAAREDDQLADEDPYLGFV